VPIHNLGYRTWDGEMAPSATRWTVIAQIGIRRAWQSPWLRRMMFFAWMPSLIFGIMIFVFEQTEQAKSTHDSRFFVWFAQQFVAANPAGGSLVSEIQRVFSTEGTPDERRHVVWSMLLLGLFRRSQPFILIPVIGVIAPPLISQDFRSRAFLLYFSRPLSKVQYILGKGATIMFFLTLITLLPALLLFAFGVLLSPDLSVLKSTWDFPFRILVVSMAISIPSTSLALMMSSLTSESRFASFGWMSVWIFGYIAYQSVSEFSTPGTNSLIQCVSLFHVFSDVAGWMLDPRLGITGIDMRLILLTLLTAISLAVVYRRVSAPMEI
jgi:ABC-2 type transport system permease protein